jgi:DNA replication protein DnaC
VTQTDGKPVEDLGDTLKQTPTKSTRSPASKSETSLPETTLKSSPPLCARCKGSGNLSEGYCECEKGQAGKARHLLVYANLPNAKEPKTFDNFQEQPYNAAALAAAREFANGQSANSVLTFWGPNGTGKSHLIEAIGRLMMTRGVWVKYAFSADLLDTLRASYSDDAEGGFEKAYGLYSRPAVLMLDDLGAEKSTEWAVEKLTRLIDDRYRQDRPMVVATNMTEAVMAERLSPRLADRLFDYRTGKVRVVNLSGESYRTGHQWRASQAGRRG